MGEIVEAVLAQPNLRWETASVLAGGRSVRCPRPARRIHHRGAPAWKPGSGSLDGPGPVSFYCV